MEELDMNYLCSVMGSLSGVPIRLYDGDELEFFYSTVHLPKDPIVVYKEQMGTALILLYGCADLLEALAGAQFGG